MSNFDLVSNATVCCYGIRAKIRVFEKLEHLTPVLVHVQDVKNATPDSVSDELCLKSSVLGKKLLEICEERGLVKSMDDIYGITSQGEQSVIEKTVPTEIDAVWIVYHVDHPIIPDNRKILDIDVNTGLNKMSRVKGDGHTMECWKKYVNVRMYPIPSDETMSFEIMEVSDHVLKYDGDQIHLTWNVGKTTSKIEMTPTINNTTKRHEFEHKGVTYKDVCDALFDGDWDVENNRLRVGYANLNGDEYTTMIRHASKTARIGGSDWRIEQDVDLYPKDSDAAQEWASNILADQIAKPVAQKYDAICQKMQSRFDEFPIKFKDKDDLIQDIQDACRRMSNGYD